MTRSPLATQLTTNAGANPVGFLRNTRSPEKLCEQAARQPSLTLSSPRPCVGASDAATNSVRRVSLDVARVSLIGPPR